MLSKSTIFYDNSLKSILTGATKENYLRVSNVIKGLLKPISTINEIMLLSESEVEDSILVDIYKKEIEAYPTVGDNVLISFFKEITRIETVVSCSLSIAHLDTTITCYSRFFIKGPKCVKAILKCSYSANRCMSLRMDLYSYAKEK